MFRSKFLQSAIVYFRHHHASVSYFTIKDTLQIKPIGSKIVVKGWVQAYRKHKNVYFVDLKDGTCLERLQIILPDSDKCPSYGSSIKVEGSLVKSSYKGQEVELLADNWSTFGECPSGYPFENRQKYSSEYIRQYLHLRARTKKISSILRVSSNATKAVHDFFQNEGFYLIRTPVITRNDCEGAGEVFSVQMKQKLPNKHSQGDIYTNKIGAQKGEVAAKSEDVEEFFGVPTYLTVSGQLHLEAMASALSRVYNFGPVFRAESSQTRQHASEFHMVEAEIAFTETVEELVNMVEKCIKYVAKSIFDKCYPEVQFLFENVNVKEEYLEKIIIKPFVVLSYNDAVQILEENKDSLNVSIKWGDDLSTEHKQYLVQHCDNLPVFVTMFPSSLKPFYMKVDENNMEAYCFDLFASYGGEICGGSLRESNELKLESHSVFNSHLSWYADLRRYGGIPLGGFGIGFDRLLQSLLGISNIRDVIPFPRRKYDCKC